MWSFSNPHEISKYPIDYCLPYTFHLIYHEWNIHFLTYGIIIGFKLMKIQQCVKFCWFCLRYIEAIDMNKKLGSSKVSRRGAADLPVRYSPLGPRSRNLYGSRADTGVPAKTMLTTRDLIINSVAKSLPSVTRELADYCNKEKSLNWRRGKLRFQ